MVRLKVEIAEKNEEPKGSFNSKMVRLKDIVPGTFYRLSIKFQFQNGAIKSNEQKMALGAKRSFNSKMVRLKAEKLSNRKNGGGVSIPKWCD